jgi:hypothetical protein
VLVPTKNGRLAWVYLADVVFPCDKAAVFEVYGVYDDIKQLT